MRKFSEAIDSLKNGECKARAERHCKRRDTSLLSTGGANDAAGDSDRQFR